MNSAKAIEKLFPAFVVCIGVVLLVLAARTPEEPENGFPLNRFATIAVQENGRLMPFDTYARTKVMLLSHRQTVEKEWDVPRGGKESRRISANEWALEQMVLLDRLKALQQNGGQIDDLPRYYVFRIDNDQLLQLLGLQHTKDHGYLFTISDFINSPEYRKEKERIIANRGPQKGNLLDEKIAELMQKEQTFMAFVTANAPDVSPPAARGGDAVAAVEWQPLAGGEDGPLSMPLERAFISYAQSNKVGFERALDDYSAAVDKLDPGIASRSRLEVFFNNFAPYYQCIILFCGVLVLALASWVVEFLDLGIGSTDDRAASTWPQTLRSAAMGLGALAIVVYTGALIARIIISGYAPVTNLYSSAIFIGWGCALLCLGLEFILKNGIGAVVASVTAVTSLIIAHNLLDGDSMGKVVAVLESNFWLSTHVICITLGYTATFVAGFLGIAYVMLGIFTNLLRRDHILFSKVIYGVICFALFLSFVGTVLGGIWADQSWGRFWGWDPKENGALLIVIWNAVILHARWGGMAKSRGVALLAVFGNIVTAWSWFGTNLLGVGLHNYGFMQGAFYGLIAFAISQVIIILIGALTPSSMWASFRPLTPPSSPKASSFGRPALA